MKRRNPMAGRFQTRISKARFTATVFTPQVMQAIAEPVALAIRQRISAGMDAQDQPAPPLKVKVGAKNPNAGYRGLKQRRGLKPIRDWTFTGRTLRSLKVLSAAANKAVIGFTDAVSNMRAAINNRRWRQFGLSPKDQLELAARVKVARRVTTQRVA